MSLPKEFAKDMYEAIQGVFDTHIDTMKERVGADATIVKFDPMWYAGDNAGKAVWQRITDETGTRYFMSMKVTVNIPVEEK